MTVPPEVLNAFQVVPGAFLGGRLNQHWRVSRGGSALVLRRWHDTKDVSFEREVRSRVSALGWPVPLDVSEVMDWDGGAWSLMTLLPGQPHPEKNSPGEQGQRGQVLAEFHLATAELAVPPRADWRNAAEILNDPDVERVFINHPHPEESRLYLWHLERARQRAADLSWTGEPRRLIHGDFTPWNLLFEQGKLSGLLDFELSRPEFRMADFCLSWRGEYDAVVWSYHDVFPITDQEWQMLTPVWWAFLLEVAYRDLRQERVDDGWVVKMLLRRSPLMHADAYRGQ